MVEGPGQLQGNSSTWQVSNDVIAQFSVASVYVHVWSKWSMNESNRAFSIVLFSFAISGGAQIFLCMSVASWGGVASPWYVGYDRINSVGYRLGMISYLERVYNDFLKWALKWVLVCKISCSSISSFVSLPRWDRFLSLLQECEQQVGPIHLNQFRYSHSQ